MLIALDWGSSRLRGWRIDAAGAVLDQRGSDQGASRIAGGPPAFDAALRSLAGDWLEAEGPVIACGMVGSAHGWREAAYAACPLPLDTLHRALVTVDMADGRPVHIVPGLKTRGAVDGLPDVMRGEETQLLGLLAAEPALMAGATVVLPGTHSKWVHVRDGTIAGFATHLTGELFAVLREHSVLGRLMSPGAGFDTAAFDRGRTAADAPGGLTHALFGVRTLGLFGELPAAAAADYLSGLLIGTELQAALPAVNVTDPIVLVGEADLCRRYHHALAARGREARIIDRPLAAEGLWRLARAAGLVG